MQGVNEVLRCDDNAPLEKNRRNALKLLALQMLRRSGPFPHPVCVPAATCEKMGGAPKQRLTGAGSGGKSIFRLCSQRALTA